MVKVAAVALIVLIVGALAYNSALLPKSPLIARSCSDDPSDLCHYEQFSPSIVPFHERPVVPFEQYVKGFPHNGLWISKTDEPLTSACQISPSLQEFSTCLPYVNYMKDYLDLNPKRKPEVYSKVFFDTKGYKFQVDNDFIILGMNPKIRENYERALQVAEEKVLTPHFVESDIEEVLKTINQALLDGLNNHEGTPS